MQPDVVNGIEVAKEVLPDVIKQFPPSYGPPGSYVNLAERAVSLIAALDSFAQINKRKGFEVASRSGPYRKNIEARYGYSLPWVQEGTESKIEKLDQETRVNFWRATGYAALREPQFRSLVRGQEIDAQSKKWWRDFSALYSHPKDFNQLNTYRKTLWKTIKAAEKEQVKVA